MSLQDVTFEFTVAGAENLSVDPSEAVTFVSVCKRSEPTQSIAISSEGKGNKPAYGFKTIPLSQSTNAHPDSHSRNLSAADSLVFKIKDASPASNSSTIGEAALSAPDIAKLEQGKAQILSLPIGTSSGVLNVLCRLVDVAKEATSAGAGQDPASHFIVRWGGDASDDKSSVISKPAVLRDFEPDSPIVMAGSTSQAGFCITESGQAWWWGVKMSVLVKLNNGNYLKPQKIPGLEEKKIVHLAVGENHALFVSDAGVVYSVGSNDFGELGVGDDDSHGNAVQTVMGLDGIKIVKVFAAAHCSWAVSEDGRVFSWGEAEKLNDYDYTAKKWGAVLPLDTLGHSEEDVAKRTTRGFAGIPAEVAGFPEGTQIDSVAASTARGSIYVAKDGSVYVICTGCVRPDESGKAATTPQKVPGIPAAKLAGLGVTHGVVLDREGGIWVWGCTLPSSEKSGRPELGLGKGAPAAFTPVKLATIEESVVDLVVADHNTIVLTSSGQVLRWGKEADSEESRLNGQSPIYAPKTIAGLNFKVVKLGLGVEQTTTLVCM